MFKRYTIIHTTMHQEAAAKMDRWAAEQKVRAEEKRRGQLKRFAGRSK